MSADQVTPEDLRVGRLIADRAARWRGPTPSAGGALWRRRQRSAPFAALTLATALVLAMPAAALAMTGRGGEVTDSIRLVLGESTPPPSTPATLAPTPESEATAVPVVPVATPEPEAKQSPEPESEPEHESTPAPSATAEPPERESSPGTQQEEHDS